MFVFLSILTCFALPPSKISIVFFTPKPGTRTVIRVSGLDRESCALINRAEPKTEDWNAMLKIVVAGDSEAETEKRPPVFGSYRIESDNIIFEPRFPFSPGTSYHVTFDPLHFSAKEIEPLFKTLVIPKPDAPPAKVTAIYPSADEWPENTLRLYLHFSAPMSQGQVYEHIKLLREDGTTVSKPFLELDEELWNPDGTRFTLLFDPGRIKNGLLSKEEAGANLERGKSYTLAISKEWKDANGRPRAESFKKSFRVTAFDDRPIDPDHWELTTPSAGKRTSLTVAFPKPLDRALLNRMIAIEGENGKRIDGEIAITDRETKWTFVPSIVWAKGKYRLVVDTRLEDTCGNRVGSPFEIDVFRTPTRRLEAKTVSRSFVVK